MGAFDDLDFTGFWSTHPFSDENYVEPSPDDATVASIEAELGVRLPAAYVELARRQNGGMLDRSAFPMDEPTSWASDHIQVTGIHAIGRTARYSLCGGLGSAFMREEWGYPDIGVAFADTPSAGHELLMLDYRACGPEGEPSVVHVDQEADYRITPVAPDFASFIRGLVDGDAFDEDEAEALEADLTVVRDGSFSPIIRRAGDSELESQVRALGERIVRAKGFFALHADGDSWLMYDAMFLFYSRLATAASFDDFARRPTDQVDYERPCYELMIPFSLHEVEIYGFRTGGFAIGFLEDWWTARLASGALVAVDGGFRFDPDFEVQLRRVLRAIAG